MLKLLKVDEDYKCNISIYGKKDGVLALILFLIIAIFYAILGILNNKVDFIHKNIMMTGCISNLLMIIVTILFVKFNKQKLCTIGLVRGKWIISIIIGILLGIFYFYNNYASRLLEGYHLPSVSKIIFLIIYFFLVALCEEVVFRGYIGTRINSLVKNRYLSILLTGILFVLMHFPYRMIAYKMSLYDLFINNGGWLLNLLFFHVVMNFIYSRTNSLYGSIIPHWLSDLGYDILVK